MSITTHFGLRTSLFFVVLWLFISCNKLEPAERPSLASNGISQSNINWLFSGDNEQISHHLTAFIKQALDENIAERSNSQNLSIEDGLGLIESALHFQFHNDRSKLVEHTGETIEITIPLAQENVLEGKGIEQAFVKLKEIISSRLSTEQQLFLIDLDAATAKNSDRAPTLQVTAYLLFGKKGVEPDCEPNETDDWRICCDAGKCDGTKVGKDAADRLEDVMNNQYCQPVCAGGTVEYWLLSRNEPFVYDHSSLGKLVWTTFVGHQYRCLPYPVLRNCQRILNDIIEIRRPAPSPVGPYSFGAIQIVHEEKKNGDISYTEYNGRVYYVVKSCYAINDHE